MQNRITLSPQEKQRLSAAVTRFPDLRVLIVGDLMLDTFLWGDVTRISPEAPVPVVEVIEETQLLGGAANVVHNVAAMGARASVCGIVGDDYPGRELKKLFNGLGVPTEGLIIAPNRPTTIKTRVIAHNQQVVRFDREQKKPLGQEQLDQVLSFIRHSLPELDGMIISDYAKGMITPGFMDAVRSFNGNPGLPIFVDPKVQHLELYRGTSMVTPNHHEAARMSGVEIRDEKSLVRAGKVLLDRLECKTVLITRGKDGMSLFHEDGRVVHIPTIARRVFDVTGAGDTVIAAIALGVISGLPPVEAAILANIAAGIVVGEIGTAAVSREQLLSAIDEL